MHKHHYLIIYLIFISCVYSQNLNLHKNKLVVINTIDYNSYVGTIQTENIDSLIIETYDGSNIHLSKSDILLSYDFKGRIKNNRLQRQDPNSSFYLFSPSAFSIDNGNLYCRDFCLFYPSLNYGLANIVSLQAGVFWYPGMDYENVPYVGNLKFTAFQTDIISIAGGISYIHLPDIKEQDIYSAGYAYATITFGDRYNHASVSAGWGYIQEEEEWKQENKPIVIIAGNFRLLNSLSLVTENWIFPDKEIEDSLLSASLRFFGRQVAVDLGAILSVSSIQEKIEPIPVVNLTYHLR